MPTVITVPIGQRDKSIKFGAAYSPSLSFNPDKKLLVGCSGLLAGMGVTVNTGPVPAEITVDPGAFIQRGIIVNVTSSQLVQFPGVPTFPLFLVAENANEVFNSSVQYLFTTTPAADSCIIASWPVGPITAPEIPIHISNCGLAEAISALSLFVVQHDRQVSAAAQTVFTLPPAKAYVVGANKLQVYRNGKKLVVNDEYAENTPTQFTLNFPAVLGDIFDLIIFKGSPPITSIALTDLTDVTGNLANAIKDPSVLRSSLATQANPLATIADIAASQTPQNFLANGGFRFAQRQAPATLTTIPNSSRGYAADRWGVTSLVASAQYQRVDTLPSPEAGLSSRYYGKFRKAIGVGKMVIVQPLESKFIESLRGQTARFQIKMKRSVAPSMTVRLGLVYLTAAGTEDLIPTPTVTVSGGPSVDPTWNTNLVALTPSNPINGSVVGFGVNCVLATSWVNYSASFTVPADAKNLCVAIWNDSAAAVGDELNLSEASLHSGSTDATWLPMDPIAELKLCQRYYFKTFNVDQVPVAALGFGTGCFRFFAPAVGVGSTMFFPTTLPVPIRFFGGAIINTYNPISANSAVRDLSNNLDQGVGSHAVNGDRHVEIYFNKNAGTSPGAFMAVHYDVDSEM